MQLSKSLRPTKGHPTSADGYDVTSNTLVISMTKAELPIYFGHSP